MSVAHLPENLNGPRGRRNTPRPGAAFPFMGFYNVQMDNKFRFSIPAVFRQQMGRSTLFVVIEPVRDRVGPKRHLMTICGEQLFQKMTRRLEGAQREFLFQRTFQRNLDGMGRVNLSQDIAHLLSLNPGEPLVVSGCGNHLEVWKRNDWEKAVPRIPNGRP